MSVLISTILTIIYAAVSYYITLPALNLHSIGFWVYGFSILIVFAFANLIVQGIKHQQHDKLIKGTFITSFAVLIVFLVLLLGSSKVFHAGTYANRIQVTSGAFEDNIPTVNDLKKIPLMDTASASILGNRVVGSLTDLVSQYNVSETYTTICYNGAVMKISPLVYEGFFKYMNNKANGIPGYVLVNTETNEAQFVRLEQGIQYSPSAYFSKDLYRKIRFSYPTKMIQDYCFQVDNEGNPYWVVTCMEKKTFLGAEVPTEVILMNAITGDSELYSIKDTPKWIDYVYSGNIVCDLYNTYGTLQKGFINSLIGQKNCTQTTDDFGYVIKDDDVYVYTGVTSTVSDESNLGFIMVNSRTGEYVYYTIPGAEEHSAMSAAEGAVQNYGYHASFPALINVGGEPTYALVLKDDSGLVKLYAMVNVKNYTIVATATTMTETLKSYKQALNTAGTGLNIDFGEDALKTTFKIAEIEFLLYNNETVCYIKDVKGNVYKQNFNENESLVQLKVGDTITVTYEATEDGSTIYPILDLTK